MGNRAYFTLKNNDERKTFYIHWNGGLDTFAPLAQALFSHNVREIDSVIQFLKLALEFKPELQESPDAATWTDENGHYTIDLEDKTMIHRLENGNTHVLSDLRNSFEQYVLKHIRQEYQENSRVEYWDGITSAASKYFGGAK